MTVVNQHLTAMKTDFTFVDPVYDSIFAEAQQKGQARAIYFGKGVDLEEANGKITGVETNALREQHLCFEDGTAVRVDRIISINGIPGPAFEEYDRHASACMQCNFDTPESD